MDKAYPASIYKLYQAFGRGDVSGFTVPAINLRILTTDVARLVFRLMREKNIGPVIFEIARSEQKYTGQPPEIYTGEILQAAAEEKFTGPVFIQADHYQFKRDRFLLNPQEEIEHIKQAIKESVAAGFYNIDIDASTLVDLDETDIDEQQRDNYRLTALMAQYIREIQPDGIDISIGGEIGHIGGKNSTVEDFEAFMSGLNRQSAIGNRQSAISKVSIQTGTSHGGVPLPDGSMEKMTVDFTAIKNIGRIAREKYGLAGVVQHGASTLPDNLFGLFPENGAVEIHLATEWQNLVFDHLPADLKTKIYDYIMANFDRERKPEWTEGQFIYKMRKKALGPFKRKIESLPEAEKKPIMEALEKKLLIVFQNLRLFGTKEVIKQYYNF